MQNTAFAYDAADKPPVRPTAPPLDVPMQSASFVAPPQPQREPSTSFLYATPVQQPPSYPSMPPMPPMPPMPTQHSGYFQPPQAPPKYDAPYQAPPPFYTGPSQRAEPPMDDDEEDSSFTIFLKETCRLVLFHTLNALLGYVAFSVCVGGVATSVGLLPLCCLGIVVFRLLLYAVYGFAQLDVMLFNFITPPEDHIYVRVPSNPRNAVSLSGERLAPTLSSFSPLSLMALIYFCSIKFLLSTLSSVCFSLVVTAPLSLVCAVLGLGHGPVFEVQFGPEDVAEVDSDPLLFLLATACLFLIGVALMHLVAKASREATRFFCCEKFSTYRYVHHPSHEDSSRHLLYPPAASGAPLHPQAYAQAYGAIPPPPPPPPPPAEPSCRDGNGRGSVVIRFNAGGV